jgi:hypothetical protein
LPVAAAERWVCKVPVAAAEPVVLDISQLKQFYYQLIIQ